MTPEWETFWSRLRQFPNSKEEDQWIGYVLMYSFFELEAAFNREASSHMPRVILATQSCSSQLYVGSHGMKNSYTFHKRHNI